MLLYEWLLRVPQTFYLFLIAHQDQRRKKKGLFLYSLEEAKKVLAYAAAGLLVGG